MPDIQREANHFLPHHLVSGGPVLHEPTTWQLHRFPCSSYVPPHCLASLVLHLCHYSLLIHTTPPGQQHCMRAPSPPRSLPALLPRLLSRSLANDRSLHRSLASVARSLVGSLAVGRSLASIYRSLASFDRPLVGSLAVDRSLASIDRSLASIARSLARPLAVDNSLAPSLLIARSLASLDRPIARSFHLLALFLAARAHSQMSMSSCRCADFSPTLGGRQSMGEWGRRRGGAVGGWRGVNVGMRVGIGACARMHRAASMHPMKLLHLGSEQGIANDIAQLSKQCTMSF